MPDSAPPVESMVSSLASSSQREAGAVMPHQSDVSRHWEDALKNQAQGWYLEAIRGLKFVAAHADYHRKAWYRIGQCYMAMGRSADALAAFHTSLGMSAHQTRESAPIYQSIGDVLERLGRFDEASRYYDLAQFVDPKIVCGGKVVVKLPRQLFSMIASLHGGHSLCAGGGLNFSIRHDRYGR